METKVYPELYPHLVPGTYRATRDLPAVLPDKRKRHDWRADAIKAGDLFSVKINHDGFTEVWRSGGYSINSVYVRNGQVASVNRLFESLEPVEETASLWLVREHSGMNVADEILDVLIRSGKITLDDVKQACEVVFQE